MPVTMNSMMLCKEITTSHCTCSMGAHLLKDMLLQLTKLLLQLLHLLPRLLQQLLLLLLGCQHLLLMLHLGHRQCTSSSSTKLTLQLTMQQQE